MFGWRQSPTGVRTSAAGTTRRTAITALVAAGAAPQLLAQGVYIRIPGRERQYPIAVAPFRGQEQAPQPVSTIVLADLERSGFFRSVDPSGFALDELARPDMNIWRDRGASWLVGGSMTRQGDGRFDVRFRLWDVARSQDLGGQSYVVAAADLRLAAHRIADFIYERIVGQPGIFSTRIAYVTKAARYNLWVADADGENAQAALTSPEPIISPAWSPNGQQLAYVSFESRKPVIYIHDVASGQRRLLANFRGSNSAPAWSPDGSRLAVTLTRDGGSQIYTIAASGGEPTRLLRSSGIDTEPVYSSDGQYIYFVSDRGGSPQIYRTGATGGAAQRITFNGSYNISPSVSADGALLAYISRDGGYKLCVQDLASGTASAITDTTADESPSFAPNSQLLIYATRQGGSNALMTTTADGAVKMRLPAQPGEVREPAWGPLVR
ncbi:translocation protein TolB [Lampropedia cohaerens]|uniref:Tol-Pal system protein TolB n=1 Tax=Lampropedia cohaerens TaxID=1610491 RepID=A0A0U1PZQ6_9BURK|nr:Tol-Pal system beta propeller repeat protein TolB [Lampropedia cohaerens]KKW68008.1 translocation protein TolB [Lampropedia cohaerens]